MIATATMWHVFGKLACTELETGNEIDGKIPLWITIAPVAVDMVAYWQIGTAIS